MLDITEDAIRAAVTDNAFAAAEAYVRQGRVRRIEADPDIDLITAKVQGSEKRPYSQTIWLERDKGGRWQVDGECSCPVGGNCKHVAAVLLAHMRNEAILNAPAAGALPLAMPGQARLAPPVPRQQDVPATAPTAPAAPTLGAPLTAWLRDLTDDLVAESDDYPESVFKRLFYVLHETASAGRRAPSLQVVLAASDIKRDGTINRHCSNPNYHQLLHGPTPPKYLRPADRAILRHLNFTGIDEQGADPAETLRAILATGRARLGGFPGIPATEGPGREGAISWHLAADGMQHPVLTVPQGGVPVLLPAPWYLDSASGTVGPILLDVPPRALRRLLDAPPVPPDQAAALGDALRAALPGTHVPPPRELPAGDPLMGVPTPHIRLRDLPVRGGYYDVRNRLARGGIWLSFRYENALVPLEHQAHEFIHDGTRRPLIRDHAAEAAADAQLQKLGLRWLHRVMPYLRQPGSADSLVMIGREPDDRWLEFMMDGLPRLRELGWEIEVDGDFPHQLIAPTAPFQAELREGSGIDWFEFDLGVQVGDERIDLVGPLLGLLRQPEAADMIRRLRDADATPGRPMVLGLPDGRRLALDMAAIKPLLLTLFDLFGAGGLSASGDILRVSRHGAADVAALEQAGLAADMVWRGGEALRALGRQLRDHGCIAAAEVPTWFQASLRPYQQRGVDWLQFLRQAGLAGVLADDMGLGKTVQTLAHLAVEKQAGRLTQPALVICPTSVVGNWAREAARFAPSLRVLALQGLDRKNRFDQIADSDIVISTYPLLTRDDDVLTVQHWHSVILDEAQTVKNPAATMAQTVRRLRAGQRICLTGTPMENHLGELWALFDFMMPGFLGSQQDFGRRFRTPIEKGGDTVLHAALAKRVAPFLLRRTKAEVVTELPPRTDIVETVQMQPAQRAIYEAIRLAMHTKVQQAIAEQGLAKSGIVILDALLKMRQACCDPRLLKIDGKTKQKAGSAKLERLLELMATLLDEGRTILLFSQFTSMLALIEESLDKLGIAYALLTGETRDRTTQVDDFQAGRKRVFLVSLKAGGVGLNLTAADTVIHYDPWWNPAVENQATDRAHRIGQTKSVFVHRLITENSIEEKMEVLKARKSALAEGILTGAGANALKMTEADVEMLFG
jgi:superfamily II DNA or RNA helicase